MPKPATRKTEWKDEYTLLCERCGYIIEDLDHALPCPECGKPISESLPERRVGTPWQRDRRVTTLIKTWYFTLRHPIRTLDMMYVGRHVSDSGTIHALKFATIISTIIAIVFNIPFLNKERWVIDLLLTVLISPIVCLFAVGIFFALTATEQFGLKVIGRSKGFRTTEQIAQSIVNHACVGWFVLGVPLACGFLMKMLAISAYANSDTWRSGYAWIDELNSRANFILLFGWIPGFLIFETFAYLGLRRCKYANRPRPTDQPQP